MTEPVEAPPTAPINAPKELMFGGTSGFKVTVSPDNLDRDGNAWSAKLIIDAGSHKRQIGDFATALKVRLRGNLLHADTVSTKELHISGSRAQTFVQSRDCLQSMAATIANEKALQDFLGR